MIGPATANPLARGRALLCAPRLPQFDRESGDKRIIDHVDFLRDAGWQVTFFAHSGSRQERYAIELEQQGVPTFIGPGSWEDLIGGHQFDLVTFSFWHAAEFYMPDLRRLSPKARVIVDSLDLHFMRGARGSLRGLGERPGSTLLDINYASLMAREINAYASADGVLAVSEKEAGLINDLIGDPGLAFHVPDCEEISASGRSFSEREGILFIGNFQHVPNVEAAEYLCREIAPKLKPKLTRKHPIYVVGNALDDDIKDLAKGLPFVRMVGWVPSLIPYLASARLSVVPLLHGAGTKRKLIQSLMAGTPCVSTSVGAEGLELNDREHVLIADNPADFANAVYELAHDPELWAQLSRSGREHVVKRHGREVARAKFLEALAACTQRKPKLLAEPDPSLEIHGHKVNHQYQALIKRIRQAVRTVVPPDSTILVASKGDPELLKLECSQAWHFPRAQDGQYRGYYPLDSPAAIEDLEEMRRQGADFLLFPETSLWWLEHYAEFAEYLEQTYRLVWRQDETGAIFELRSSAHGSRERTYPPQHNYSMPSKKVLPERGAARSEAQASLGEVLVLGVYLANKKNQVQEIIGILKQTSRYQLTQRWVALGGEPPNDAVAAVTVKANPGPKFQIMNELLDREDLVRYDFVVLIDDDILLPPNFMDEFLSLQAELGFEIAQPARTSNSFIDHPIVEQQHGILARETHFVEIGPLVSFHRPVFPIAFPFDMTSPMGWGYENIWSHELSVRRIKMGIIDGLPVDHSLRPPVANYSWDDADSARTKLLEKNSHKTYDECFTVEAIIPKGTNRDRKGPDRPRISVVIPTHNRSDLLSQSLDSLAGQTISPDEFEVVVVDDGSTDGTGRVCRSFSSHLRMKYFRIDNSGLGAAKRLGTFATTAPLVHFFDDDDLAAPGLLEEHLKAHEENPDTNIAVLGYTGWAPSLEVTEAMRFATEVGQIVFAYKNLRDGQILDFTYFWGGRSSCKRSLLVQHGVFDQRFRFSPEDIELAYRLSKFGFKVVYNANAISYMNRPLTHEDLCRRAHSQGRYQLLFSRLHPVPEIIEYCAVAGAESLWLEAESSLPAKLERIHQIESGLTNATPSNKSGLISELHLLYEETIKAIKARGIIEASRDPVFQI